MGMACVSLPINRLENEVLAPGSNSWGQLGTKYGKRKKSNYQCPIMSIAIELVLLAVSVLFFLSILAGKAGYKFGVPALLLFLAVGMLFGSDGLGIQFESIELAQVVGTVALCIILFSGGMDTKIEDIRPVLAQGVVLATLGVLLTALMTGVAIWF